MLLLPPPNYHPTPYNASSQGNTLASMAAPPIETTNALSHPVGPEYQLVVGEGTYILRDDLRLAAPPPHPSEIPAANPNPLTTTPAPPSIGIKMSLCVVGRRRNSPKSFTIQRPNSAISDIRAWSIKEQEESSISQESEGNGPTALPPAPKTPIFGEINSLLTPMMGKDVSKRRKPKTSLIKSNSSFISRVSAHDSMSKRIQDHDPQGLFAFVSFNRAFEWLDLSSILISKAEHLIKIIFAKSVIMCHDINQATKTIGHIDVVMGSSSGDIIHFEAYSQKYNRINKNGIISTSSVSGVHWVPGSENLFLVSQMDGTITIYDKEREDAVLLPEEIVTQTEDVIALNDKSLSLHIIKSINSKNQKANPVASWKISPHCINDFAFSPDGRHLAVVSEDGSLRLVDYLKEQLTDIYRSYYGGFICVCWSPDGKYIVTGGQDDLVTIWSLAERQIVARCPGHQSWVTCVAFDAWRCDDRNYRFGSVGEDRRLLLWDFNVGMLHRPKASGRKRTSNASYAVTRHRTESLATSRLRSNSSLVSNDSEEDGLIEHPVESRTRTAELPPILCKIVDDDPLTWIGFEEDYIITASNRGHIRLWGRPEDDPGNRPIGPAHT